MKTWCAIDPDDIQIPDLLVLPEYVKYEVLQSAAKRFQFVVGAALDGDYVRAYLIAGGENRINYLKVGNDGRSKPYPNYPMEPPVYEKDDLASG